eukprot:NODE_302_length_10333_cov_0.506840.p5 type:complete len:306 gc:universal NODE_302_length_10333_cov_0.506840:2805-1888(-)
MKYSTLERRELQKILTRKAGPEFIDRRNGGGGSYSYIKQSHYFEFLNRIFGFDGWNSTILEHGVDDIENVGTESEPRYNISTFCTMRLTLKDGTFREDIGYGESTNQKTKQSGLKVARKEAVTDAIKRCFRQLSTITNFLGGDNVAQVLKRAKNIPTVPKDPDEFLHFADLLKFRETLEDKLSEHASINDNIELPENKLESNESNDRGRSITYTGSKVETSEITLQLTNDCGNDLDSNPFDFEVDPQDLERARKISKHTYESNPPQNLMKKGNHFTTPMKRQKREYASELLKVISPTPQRRSPKQ